MIFKSIAEDSDKPQSGSNGIPKDQLLFVYQLELKSFNKIKLFRCEKFNRLRFLIGPSLYGRTVVLKSNYNDDYSKFDRNKYTEIDISDSKSSLKLNASGSFHFIYFDKNIDDEEEQTLGSFYVVVIPEMVANDALTGKLQTLSPHALRCQTLLSKLMGSIDTWKSKLQVSIECHYNLIHWTPIQELGASNSAYSIANQHRISQTFRTSEMKNKNIDCTLENVAEIIDWLKNDHGVISITDIVLNHTANESVWLKEHPESSYNCLNSPWLRPAFLLDRLLWNLTVDIETGKWIDRGITSDSFQEHQLETLRTIIFDEYVNPFKLYEFYLCNIDILAKKFENFCYESIFGSCDQSERSVPKIPKENWDDYSEIILIQDPEYRRLNCTVNLKNAFNFIVNRIVIDDESILGLEKWIKSAVERFQVELDYLNMMKEQEINYQISSAVDNVLKGVRYERFDPNGPKIKKITRKSPLTTEYFTDFDDPNISDLAVKELNLYDETKSCYYMAHNGWVMGDDPLRNFAEKNSRVYLRRELICWGDSVKLRYGSTPEDSPFLWSFMEKYVLQMASVFQGLRLDNCHSTPIHVAQHMLDAARRINPNMYLIAELFTSNAELDNIFVNELGINSLIRESMSAGTPFELGRQVYHYGGEPVGSFIPDAVKTNQTDNLYSRPLIPSVAHAIFFDQTHDNESPIMRRTAYDPLPSSAIVSMTYSAIGSNRGYDELVPHQIHVVNEKRQYKEWNEINETTGIISAKKILNQLHHLLNSRGFTQAFVDQRDRDTIAVTRHNPNNHQSIILTARTAFYRLDQGYAEYLNPLRIEGKLEKILFEMKMEGNPDENFEQNPEVINGFQNLRSSVLLDVEKENSEMIQLEQDTNSDVTSVKFTNFHPSSVVALHFTLLTKHSEALNEIDANIKQFETESDIQRIINKLNLIDLNYILFRCHQEEVDADQNGVYNLSNGPLIYCGLAGIMFHLARIRTHNDLGHPMCANLREGNWLPEYIVNRLLKRPNTSALGKWIQKVFRSLSTLPRYLIPRYFDSILCPLYTALLDRVWTLHSEFVLNGDNFIRRLALGGVALIGSHPPSPLPELCHTSIPKSFKDFESNEIATMAAGLPHFCSGYMRNWGRDTFISLKGLLLITGRFDEAKTLILGFGGCLRHGLIPNLLDGGKNPRYNCRDAVWWWLQAIKDYVKIVPDGHRLLGENVRRIFPQDDAAGGLVVFEPLHETMQESLQRHFDGINFTERNAGTQIDAHMTSQGFKIQVGVDRNTGFVYGGNRWNCGTWMDKMGSSEKAKNRGKPATPRDGSAVEIVALSYSVLSFLAELNKKNQYPYEGVETTWTFDYWSQKIKENFEKHFFISSDCVDSHVNRRGIYKDTLGATIPWMDYQLRPNFLVAMSIAPEIFDSKHAIEALELVSNVLIGPLGIKTLDPSDWTYRGNYDNSSDTEDHGSANGFNYHNGPEWLWPMGHYLMARLKFGINLQDEIQKMEMALSKHFQHISQSEWFGLPELTNQKGRFCEHGCPIQSWSHATLLEALYLKISKQNCPKAI